MSLSDVTLIVHSYNRPDLLFRLLRYYSRCPELADVEIIVADGSREAERREFLRRMSAAGISLDYRMMPFPPELPLHHRIEAVLAVVTRPLLLLAADDDFYLFDWLVEAIDYLARHPDTGIAYGQYLTFSLGGFRAFSDRILFAAPVSERPPIPWQEQPSGAERLSEIARLDGGLTTLGWYALQRTDLFKRMVAMASGYDLPMLLFEKFLVVAQAAATKAHMIDRLFIARQSDVDPDRDPPSAPFGLRENRAAVERLKACCAEWLTVECEIVDAQGLIDEVLAAELRSMRDADRKRFARALAGRWPMLNRLRRRNPVSADPDRLAVRDHRLMQPRPVRDFKPYTAMIAREVLP